MIATLPHNFTFFATVHLKRMPLLSLLQRRILLLILLSFFILYSGLISAQINRDTILISINKYHQTLNEEYAHSETSPLDSVDLVMFSALNIFPANIDFYIKAVFKKSKGEKKFKMKTTTTRLPEYKKYGEVTFEIKGEKFKLNVYQNIKLLKKKEYKKHLFLPFTDLTNGETTYGGGRYIDLEIPKENTIVIDFNKAYNPYCAYSHKYSCPIPPAENFLNIKIEAGVKEGLIYK